MDVGNLISGSSAFSKSSLNIWKFMVHVLLTHFLECFEHYLASVWDECNCVVVWICFGIVFLWDWIENWPFPVKLALRYFFFASLFTWDRNLPYRPSPLSCDWISWCLSIQSSRYCQMRDITQEVFKPSTKGVLGLTTLRRTPDWPLFLPPDRGQEWPD